MPEPRFPILPAAQALAAIALGSNLGDRAENLSQALMLTANLGQVIAVSTFHDTEPVGYLNQPRFLNAALLLGTPLAPQDLLYALLEIERSMGRDRASVPAKGPRIIDLDLIFHGDAMINTPNLVLPHPAMHLRQFVLAPLAELAPAWQHPITRRSVAQMLAGLLRPAPALDSQACALQTD